VLIFTRTKHRADRVAAALARAGFTSGVLHANRSQSQRQRALDDFRKGAVPYLVATDIAARGIDVTNISHVINYDIPEDPEVYVHRVGRTARMGAAGKAFTIVMPGQGDELSRVESLINMVITPAQVEGFDPRPMPGDWKGDGLQPSAPAPATKTPAVTLPKRSLTIGSKIPLSRRHRRRR
jgi:ATP-dependent RNA helicase RhlE